MASPDIRDPKVIARRKDWYSFSNLYKDYLSVNSLPGAKDTANLPLSAQLVVASISYALQDTEAGHRERKLILERVEGKARDIQEHHVTLDMLKESAFAKGMAELTKPKTKQVMIEPGPDKDDPKSGALYAEIIDDGQ